MCIYLDLSYISFQNQQSEIEAHLLELDKLQALYDDLQLTNSAREKKKCRAGHISTEASVSTYE